MNEELELDLQIICSELELGLDLECWQVRRPDFYSKPLVLMLVACGNGCFVLVLLPEKTVFGKAWVRVFC